MSEGNTECKSRTGEGKKPGTVESEGWTVESDEQ